MPERSDRFDHKQKGRLVLFWRHLAQRGHLFHAANVTANAAAYTGWFAAQSVRPSVCASFVPCACLVASLRAGCSAKGCCACDMLSTSCCGRLGTKNEICSICLFFHFVSHSFSVASYAAPLTVKDVSRAEAGVRANVRKRRKKPKIHYVKQPVREEHGRCSAARKVPGSAIPPLEDSI